MYAKIALSWLSNRISNIIGKYSEVDQASKAFSTVFNFSLYAPTLLPLLASIFSQCTPGAAPNSQDKQRRALSLASDKLSAQLDVD